MLLYSISSDNLIDVLKFKEIFEILSNYFLVHLLFCQFVMCLYGGIFQFVLGIGFFVWCLLTCLVYISVESIDYQLHTSLSIRVNNL